MTMILSAKQAAEQLGVTSSTVANLVKQGKLRDLRGHVQGRHVLAFDPVDVKALAKTYRAPKVPVAPPPTPQDNVLPFDEREARNNNRNVSEAMTQLVMFQEQTIRVLAGMAEETRKQLDHTNARLAEVCGQLNQLIAIWSR